MRNLSLLLSVLLFISFVTISCNNDNDVTIEDIDTTAQAEVSLEKDFVEFISLPSPIETSLILQKAGATYDESLLNSADNYDKYTSTFTKAIILGVYSADMCFASMFNQSQASLNYLTVTKKLSEDIGIIDAVDNNIFERMEKNANEKDSLMYVLSDIIMNADMILKESERAETAAVILAGGWVEGLYISVNLVNNIDANDDLIKIVVDQRLSLNSLIKLLDKYNESEELKPLTSDLNSLKTIFDKIEVVNSDISVETNIDEKNSIIKSTSTAKMTNELLQEITDKITEIRTKMIDGNI